MSYVALYRKYRPRTFKDVFGQEHIKTTLENAVINKKVAHAYLFSGPRGTGKTSIAKIMGMALNCSSEKEIKPCLECENCGATLSGMNTDIIEIDAASNNGVDEIRDLKEKVKFAATYGGYKVYIIDEVHMLSTGAFNALLKTLEEPPKHVIFILATTEPHKIPATIISRCQRFDFKSIDEKVIKARLIEVLEKESIEYEDVALDYVVKAAEGGMRDALSILDQVIAYSDNQIKGHAVLEVLGSVSYEILGDLIEDLNNEKPFEAITRLDEILKSGKDIKQLISTLLNMYRDILFVQTIGESARDFVLDYNIAVEIAKKTSVDKAQNAVMLLNSALNEIKFSLQPRTYLEVVLLKISMGQTVSSGSSEQSSNDTHKIGALENEIALLKTKIFELEKGQQNQIKTTKHEPAFIAPNTNSVKEALSETEVFAILDQADKELRKLIDEKWSIIHTEANNKDPKVKMLLQDVKVVAASKEMLLLTCEIKPNVNLLMQSETHQEVQTILSSVFNKEYDFKVIDIRTWDTYKNNYMKMLKSRKDKNMVVNATSEDKNTDLAKLQNMFGEDKVVVK